MRIQKTVLIGCAVAALVSGDAVDAREWHVDKDGSGDFTDIQPAVEAAAPGDTIRIGYGRFDTLHPSCVAPAWTEDAIVTVVHDNLTFIGEGPHSTVLGMSEFYWRESSDPKGFCSIDGYSAAIKDLRIENIEQAIYWYGGRLDVENCIIRGNHPAFGGIIASMDDGSLVDCRFEMGGGGTGLACAEMDSLLVKDCVFDGYGIGFTTGPGAGKIDFLNCLFNENSYSVAYAFGSYGSLRNVTISNAVSQAVQILYNVVPVVMDGLFINGADYGLLIGGTMGGGRGINVIIENTITEAVQLSGSAPLVLNNSHILPASGLGVRCSGYSGAFQTLDFTGNYWGTTDPDSIADMIIDQNDDPTLQCIVQFEPFAKGPVPTEKKSLGSFKSMFR